jgi:hypothetical protein
MDCSQEGMMKTVCSLGVGDRPFHAWEWDPHLPLDWRSRDAASLIAGEMTEWADADDPFVLGYAEYLRSPAAGDATPAQVPAASQRAAIRAAQEFAAQDGPIPWEVRARLLAGQTDSEIGTRCALPPDTIRWYEQLFFAVRARRKARKYLLHRAVGDGVHRGFLAQEVGNFWAWAAMGAGPLLLDMLIATFHAASQPGEPSTLSIYLRPGIDPRLQALVAAMVLSHYGPAAQAWTASCLWLYEANTTDDEDRRDLLKERARDHIVRCARNYLAGKPLPRPRRRPQSSEGRGASGARGARARGTSLDSTLLDVLGHTVGVDSRFVKAPASGLSAPS